MSGFFHVSNGISLLWLTTTVGISLCGRIPPCKHYLASSAAFRSDQQFNSALRVQWTVISGYFEMNEERALKAKEKLGFKRLEPQPDSQTQGLEVRIVYIPELCLHCVLFSLYYSSPSRAVNFIIVAHT